MSKIRFSRSDTFSLSKHNDLFFLLSVLNDERLYNQLLRIHNRRLQESFVSSFKSIDTHMIDRLELKEDKTIDSIDIDVNTFNDC
jgi:hypothetical protein